MKKEELEKLSIADLDVMYKVLRDMYGKSSYSLEIQKDTDLVLSILKNKVYLTVKKLKENE